MARRERTTALPRPRRHERAAQGRTVFGIRWDDRAQRIAILGGALALLIFVVGWVAYRLYDENISRPNTVVLKVGSDDVTLEYYAERLYKFAKENSRDSNLGLVEQSLLHKLEDETLTTQLAKAKGITVSDDDVTKAIGKEIGLPEGGAPAAFDGLLRSYLKTNNLTAGGYRRLVRAFVADTKLADAFTAEVPNTGELVVIRAVVVASKEAADAVRTRINNGESMGTIAQSQSLDDSKSKDGLLDARPPALLAPEIQAAIKDQQPGAVIAPVEVEKQFWVINLEKRDPNGTYETTIKQQLGDQKLAEALKDQRQKTKIVRSLSASDLTWAEEHAKPSQ
jgi:parvulin-like peptidyl-prolyl isomerase